MRYRCVEEYRGRYPLRMRCRLLPLGVSGDYAWRNRRPRRRSQANEGLKRAITRIHRHSGAVYGSPKIRWTLLAQGQRVGRHRVARLMRALRLRGRPYPRKKPRPRARGTELSAKNLLNQDFQAPAPINAGFRISPISARGKAGSTWPPSWTSTPGGWSAGHWVSGSLPPWPYRRLRWPDDGAAPRPGCSITPTAEANTPATLFNRCCVNMGFNVL